MDHHGWSHARHRHQKLCFIKPRPIIKFPIFCKTFGPLTKAVLLPSLDINAENVIYLIRCIGDSILESGFITVPRPAVIDWHVILGLRKTLILKLKRRTILQLTAINITLKVQQGSLKLLICYLPDPICEIYKRSLLNYMLEKKIEQKHF